MSCEMDAVVVHLSGSQTYDHHRQTMIDGLVPVVMGPISGIGHSS